MASGRWDLAPKLAELPDGLQQAIVALSHYFQLGVVPLADRPSTWERWFPGMDILVMSVDW